MRRAHIIVSTLALSMGLGIGAPALAQQAPARDGQGAGLRYLSWSGRPAPVVTASQPQRSETRAQPTARDRADLRRPSPVIPHAGSDAGTGSATLVARSPYRPATGTAPRTGLTPAGPWMGGPRVSQATAPDSRPAAIETPPPAPVTTPAPAPMRQAPAPAPAPRFTSAQVEAASRPVVQPPAPAPAPAPAVPEQPVDDPMAPRRDAPIFRMQRDAPSVDAVAGTGSAPLAPPPSGAVVATSASPDAPRQGSRYYSVHRQAGRQPDQIAMPEQIYLDAVPIELGEAPAGEDLAEPPAAPQMARNAQGRLVPVPASTDSDLP
ncbi:hypothetical protein [Brevundimonas sp.]|uniref:hypothetical protein n=1 Tax=Brevundimonas sp. TaxID=1871086 RepID=UPI002AB913F3|nr:hypothetical protein [Brevundimonas sp.]MDZ4363243.1 hypothetical protein [Brevundimonas sp.]